jgi:carbonic anhydrase
MTVPEIISKIVEGNTQFTSLHNREYFEAFKMKQEPFITLVTCCDSRVPLNALMPDTANKVFSIQNIGNQILSTEGSVDYGIYHLKTPVLMFLGHSDCGAIKAYLKGFSEESEGIKHELDFLRPIIHEAGTDMDFDTLHSHVIERNLDYQVSIAYKKYRDLIKDGKLTIIAAYYDFRGEFGMGQGKIVFVNVNKHKSASELHDLPEFAELNREQKEHFIGRLPAD